MATALLDVSVLVALLWPRHVHHRRAQAWFNTLGDEQWATCPLTELGAARVLATPAVSLGLLTVGRVFPLLREILAHPRRVFWPDAFGVADEAMTAATEGLQGPRQLTDRYLLALAA